MKSTRLTIIASAAIIMFLASTSAWADGRKWKSRGHYKDGHGYKQGYHKKYYGRHHRYKSHGYHHKYHNRHYYKHGKPYSKYYKHGKPYSKYYRHGKPYFKYYRKHHYRYPSYKTGVYFSIHARHFSLGYRHGR